MSPADPYDAAEQVANHLLGTCDSVTNSLLALELDPGLENSEQFCSHLDAMIFCCECCDWWCDNGEMSDNTEATMCEGCE